MPKWGDAGQQGCEEYLRNVILSFRNTRYVTYVPQQHTQPLSYASTLFESVMEDTMTCESCNMTRTSDFNEIIIPIGSDRQFTAQTLLSPHSEADVQLNNCPVNPDMCSNQKARGMQVIRVKTPAKVLIFHIKKQNLTELTEEIETESSAYVLHAVFVRTGVSNSQGHFCSFVKIDNCWYIYNDTAVSPVKA